VVLAAAPVSEGASARDRLAAILAGFCGWARDNDVWGAKIRCASREIPRLQAGR
jgi:hypothetical protein